MAGIALADTGVGGVIVTCPITPDVAQGRRKGFNVAIAAYLTGVHPEAIVRTGGLRFTCHNPAVLGLQMSGVASAGASMGQIVVTRPGTPIVPKGFYHCVPVFISTDRAGMAGETVFQAGWSKDLAGKLAMPCLRMAGVVLAGAGMGVILVAHPFAPVMPGRIHWKNEITCVTTYSATQNCLSGACAGGLCDADRLLMDNRPGNGLVIAIGLSIGIGNTADVDAVFLSGHPAVYGQRKINGQRGISFILAEDRAIP